MYVFKQVKEGISSKEIFSSSFDLADLFKGIVLYLRNLQKIILFDVINKSDVIRGRPRTAKTSSIEFYMKKVKALTL